MEPGDGRGGILHDIEQGTVPGAEEASFDGAVEEGEERVEVTAAVDDGNWPVVELELAPGDDLEHLLERPEPAGQDDEGLREAGHKRLAFVHGLDDAKVQEAFVGDFTGGEVPRDYADDFATGSEAGIGQGAP